MGKLDGKVAFITGVARGQGRSHAVTLAAEGAAIVGVDICRQIDTVPYAMATKEDLEETVRLVESAGGRILAREADVRESDEIQAAVDEGLRQFGHLDVLVANAATVSGFGNCWELTEQQFRDQWEVNVAGVWRSVKAVVPSMLERGRGGSIVMTASISGLASEINIGHYVASKHAVVGLMRNLAAELAPHSIRANTVCPTNVNTPMLNNPQFWALFAGKAEGTYEEALPGMQGLNALPVPFVEPIDISKAVLYLASDDSRYVTGTNMVIDAGALLPFKLAHAAGGH